MHRELCSGLRELPLFENFTIKDTWTRSSGLSGAWSTPARLEVMDIVAFDGLVIVLYETGECTVFARGRYLGACFLGEKISTIQDIDHKLYFEQYSNNVVYMSASRCAFFIAPHAGRGIQFFDVLKGKLLATLAQDSPDVTAVFYDEARHEMFVGTSIGQVSLWS